MLRALELSQVFGAGYIAALINEQAWSGPPDRDAG